MEGKTCFCGVTKYLNIISVLHRQTHSVPCYLEKTFRIRFVGKNDCGEKVTPDFVSTSESQKKDETLIATDFCCMSANVNKLHTLLLWQPLTASNRVPNVYHHRATVLPFNTSGHVPDSVYSFD